MDFTQAALLIAAVFAVTQLFKQLVPQAVPWMVQAAAIVIGIAMTFLVAYSTYAKSVTVGDVTLDKVNTAGLILIGLLISGGATLAHQVGVKALSNVGQNHDTSDPQ